MRRMLRLVVCFGALGVAGLTAQVSLGHIRGTITDGAGAVLPAVTVTIQVRETARSAVTDRNGEFRFTDLPAGRYALRAALAGFTPVTVSVEVTAGRTVSVPIQLAVGSSSEAVTVTGETPRHDLSPAQQKAGVAGGRAVTMPGAPPPRFNTEAYDRIDDNPWTEVVRRPLSTFSIDVDTASYANVRRFLNQGQRPPKDAVRVEELINYFSYDYPEPRDGKPFAVTTALGACPWNPRHRLALVGLQARRIDATKLPPRNLVFLIDVSGSMMDQRKLPLVKASLAMLTPNLVNQDRVAIVVYAGAAGLVLPSTAGSDTQTILDALGRLQAGGSTNGAQGIRLAYQVARDHFIPGGVNRLILATDGDFNVGVTSRGDLVRLIEEEREKGIALSVLGFGMGDVKDSTLETLADKGNGNYAYIDSLAEAQKVLVEEAGGTLVMVAKDVKLQVEFNPRAVAAYRLVGYENRLLRDEDFNDDRKDAGDIGAGHSVTALYELVPAGERIDVPGIDPLKYQEAGRPSTAARQNETMTVKLRYKEPDARASTAFAVPVSTRITDAPALGFAAAVAQFGMLLRDSEFKGESTFASALALAQRFKGADAHGHRAEFIRLIGAADGVSRLQSSGRPDPVGPGLAFANRR